MRNRKRGKTSAKDDARECCAYVKESFGLSNVRLFGEPEVTIERLAVSPGSGKSMITPALQKGAQLLVTGDIGHHDGIDAVDQGLFGDRCRTLRCGENIYPADGRVFKRKFSSRSK